MSIIHSAGLLPPSFGPVTTTCGLKVGMEKLAVIGTGREAINSKKTWPPGMKRYWGGVIRRRNAKAKAGGAAAKGR